MAEYIIIGSLVVCFVVFIIYLFATWHAERAMRDFMKINEEIREIEKSVLLKLIELDKDKEG